MAFDSLIPDGFPSIYADDWRLQFQQLSSRLAPFVNIDTLHGEGKRYQRLPKQEGRAITTRFGDTNPADINAEYRWCYAAFADAAHRIDRREAMQLGGVGRPHHPQKSQHHPPAPRPKDEVLKNPHGA